MKFRSLKFLSVAGLFVLPGVWRCEAQSAPSLLEVSGRGNTGPGAYDLTVSAQVTTNGTSGSIRLVGGSTGSVVQLVPPDDASRDCWCINVKRTDTRPVDGDQRVNVYIRDTGNGLTNFDQISFITSIGGDCNSFATDNLFFIPLVQGDFQFVILDADGDGVPDYRDACPHTAPNTVVNEQGCSINQIVPCEGPTSGGVWKNHGKYLGALTAAADAFLAAEQITAAERDAVVRAAARSDCGKRN